MKTVNVQFVAKSSNAKTGPIPVTTSGRDTCPDSCPLKENGCYASAGYYTRLNWDKVTAGERGGNWDSLCDNIRKLPTGAIWRHNVASDLPHYRGRINKTYLARLVDANNGRRGFTYTHHNPKNPHNADAIKRANAAGFTVNLSANNVSQADQFADLGIGPVVTILPEHGPRNFETPAGNRVVTCPATYRNNVTCASCKMCAIPDRETIIGFPVHGSQKTAAAKISGN